ncbi:galactose-binding domain-like protein [Vararia minispora EC-137]|uniref:Galactose-binding domain-like protein n=1 Tax=Vararia minispora EC-137 TaxID=1314806 RepID=A0ACB8QMA2_9AGAM|nr:galactose-binding domain-like protein [Vararia minispora EC-137]
MADGENLSNVTQIVGGSNDNMFVAIDRENVHGLNLAVPEDAKETIKPWDERESTDKFAQSNVDDQMIIHIPFVQNVRLRSILIKSGRGELTPRRLRVFANHANIIDFTDADDGRPSVDIALQEGQTSVTEYPLHVAAFANIHTLTLYFSNSTGGDLSRIYFIGFKGDLRTPRKEGTNKLPIPAANAADAPLIDKAAEKRASQPTAK